MTIHREGYSTILLVVILGIASTIPIWILLGCGWISISLTGLFIISLLFILRFFRYPDRQSMQQSGKIISPADGKIVAIQEEAEEEYFKEKRIRVSVFMSGFNVHANWIPISGSIPYCKYHPGRNLFAIHPKSSILNERSTVVILHEDGKELLVRQIAGIFARRVVTYPKIGQNIIQGAELGFIKFGSRVDLFLPLDAKPTVNIGDKVKGNVTEIASW